MGVFFVEGIEIVEVQGLFEVGDFNVEIEAVGVLLGDVLEIRLKLGLSLNGLLKFLLAFQDPDLFHQKVDFFFVFLGELIHHLSDTLVHIFF